MSGFTLRPIKPKANAFNLRKIEAAVRAAMDEARDGVLADFEKTTATWDRKVSFTATPTREGYVITPDDTAYEYVDQGTRPHVIEAKGNGVLAFGVGGRAKTQPNVIGSGPGARGDTRVFAKRVQHPGTKARNFSEIIAKKWQVELSFLMNAKLGAAVGGD